MLFNSLIFIAIFLPITLVGYYWVLHHTNHSSIKYRYGVLILASLFFYSYWDIRFVPLLLLSIFVNYRIAATLRRYRSRSAFVLGIGINLSLIIHFKYAGFLTNAFTKTVIISDIVLPLGISFYTFQQIAYLVDAYRGQIQQHNPLEYTLFVVFFPQLIAGPIVHHREIIPQFKQQSQQIAFWNSPLVAQGLVLFIVGLFKKVVLADNLAAYVDPVFADANSATFLEVWTAAIGYTLQLYFDFSGYCEMAMGSALLFGIHLPINFNSPYKANSIIDFWRRWHMTLGCFLKYYLYIPLKGNRSNRKQASKPQNKARLMLALLLTMLLGGLWHGAGWTFIVWGFTHGSYLIINHLWRISPWTIPPKLAWWITFTAIVFAWVIFRANNVSDACVLFEKMIGLNGFQLTPLYTQIFGSDIASTHSSIINGLEILVMILILLFLTRTQNIHEWLTTFKPTIRKQLGMVAMACTAFLSINNPSVFLYFQF